MTISYPGACLKVLQESGAGPAELGKWLVMYAFARFPRLARPRGSLWPDEHPPENATGSPLDPFDPSAILHDLSARGIAEGLRLKDSSLVELRRLARENETRGMLHPLAPSPASGVDSCVSCYRDTAAWQPIAAVAAALEPFARRAIGPRCAFLGSRVWWSFPRRGSKSSELQLGRKFHFDLYSWRSVSGFFYLTDVDEEAGPHVCVLGSHRRKALRHQFSGSRWREDEEVENVYGPENLRAVLGSAGTGFLEDPTCFHKGFPPVRTPRLVLQLLWGSEDFVAPGFSRRSIRRVDLRSDRVR